MTTTVERIECNRCGQWSRLPYRRGRCARCTGTPRRRHPRLLRRLRPQPLHLHTPPTTCDIAWNHRDGGDQPPTTPALD